MLAAVHRLVVPNLDRAADDVRRLAQSLAASRQYEQLRSSGMPHDAALRQALGMGLSPVRERREIPKALCFAGKA